MNVFSTAILIVFCSMLGSGDKNFKSLYKSCANTALCGGYGSMTQDPNVTIRIYVSCCEGKNCNTNRFYIPTENSTLNGLKCPSAYCENTTGACDGDLKMMACRGSETQCVDFRGRVKDPNDYQDDYCIKACINPLGCRENFKSLIGVQEIKKVKLEC
ncbi:phospholipase A2 inhibitor 31 kDa subunit-like isoform X2 [Eleutherodactylus coqui]|uniref:phospholipase A2 inhibitor 31 kDa subunit-like isoform X2 n=1 Tax=Eleutherodactylus coqui TaxID=57060 RepID=UPI00346264B4